MPFDDVGFSGTGTVGEYFGPKTRSEALAGLDDEFVKEMDERDSGIDQLCVQLFTEFSGVGENEVMTVVWPETKRELRSAIRKGSGLVMIGVQPDDPIMGLFRDGTPLAAFYASYRGAYQAGAYVVETDVHYFAHNAFVESFAGPMNTWQERASVCGEIAQEFLTLKTSWYA